MLYSLGRKIQRRSPVRSSGSLIIRSRPGVSDRLAGPPSKRNFRKTGSAPIFANWSPKLSARRREAYDVRLAPFGSAREPRDDANRRANPALTPGTLPPARRMEADGG